MMDIFFHITLYMPKIAQEQKLLKMAYVNLKVCVF